MPRKVRKVKDKPDDRRTPRRIPFYRLPVYGVYVSAVGFEIVPRPAKTYHPYSRGKEWVLVGKTSIVGVYPAAGEAMFRAGLIPYDRT
jgi:hypothetical protein